jgi:hypothetical protein
MKIPPFGEMYWPVMNDDSSLARKSAAAAISSARAHAAQRRVGDHALHDRLRHVRVIGVSIAPGQIALTRIPRAPTSRASERVKPSSPPSRSSSGSAHAAEARDARHVDDRARACSSIAVTAPRAQKNAPFRWISSMRVQPASLMCGVSEPVL